MKLQPSCVLGLLTLQTEVQSDVCRTQTDPSFLLTFSDAPGQVCESGFTKPVQVTEKTNHQM